MSSVGASISNASVITQIWLEHARAIINSYTIDVYKAGFEDAFNTDPENSLKWNYANTLLYSITIITTVGRFI
jgi:hypothetical protein